MYTQNGELLEREVFRETIQELKVAGVINDFIEGLEMLE